MGLDYTYRLYFPRERIPEALGGLSAICTPPRQRARIRLPQGVCEFPFEPFNGDAQPDWEDESYSFEIILRLPTDEALEKFTHRIDPQRVEEPRGESDLGYIYFRVDNPPGETTSCFAFIAGGNRMSWTFLDSRSVQRAFSRLLEAHGGLCGLLDMDERRLVFWWRGEETWVMLEDAWTLEAVETQMRKALRRQRERERPARRRRCLKK